MEWAQRMAIEKRADLTRMETLTAFVDGSEKPSSTLELPELVRLNV
jgi:hypothetical protein